MMPDPKRTENLDRESLKSIAESLKKFAESCSKQKRGEGVLVSGVNIISADQVDLEVAQIESEVEATGDSVKIGVRVKGHRTETPGQHFVVSISSTQLNTALSAKKNGLKLFLRICRSGDGKEAVLTTKLVALQLGD